MMKIGNIDIPQGAGLAPMAGVTDMPMRRLCFEMGAAWAVSEMLSAKGFMYAPKGTRAMDNLLAHDKSEGILGLQLFGREVQYMSAAARQLSNRGFDFIDINMGCPAPKIVSNGEGSALMKEPELAEKIIAAVVKATFLPVTVKMRAGWDSAHINAVELAKRAEQAGVAAITVHGRTRDQMYSGRADRGIIAQVKAVVSIPVIGNGDVHSADDYFAMKRETGCDGVAIGRGAQGNPWLFAEILAAEQGKPFEKPTLRERVQLALRHARMQADYVGSEQAAKEMRKHVAWTMQGLPGCARLREAVNKTQSLEELERVLNAYVIEEENHAQNRS